MGPAVAGPPPPPFGHNWPGFRLHVTRFAVLRGLYFFRTPAVPGLAGFCGQLWEPGLSAFHRG